MSEKRSESDVRMELAEQRSRFKDAKENIRSLIDDAKRIRSENDALKNRRDELNQESKNILQNAREHQARRDEINQMVGELRQQKREVSRDMRQKIDHLVSAKRERRALNQEAGAPRQMLENQVVGGLKTLLGMDMALKNEAVLFELFFEWRDRLWAKEKADEVHESMQEEWKEKSHVEEKAQALYDEIGRLFEASNREHSEAIRLFQEREETMAAADERHKAWVASIQEAKEKQKAIDAAKREADSMRDKMKKLEKELTKMVGWKRAREEQQKFEGAKKKMDGGEKMSMDDLKLLLEKGALK